MQDAERKRPGRPKKKGTSPVIETKGIINEPANEGDIVELVYENPMMFKRVFHLYSQYGVSEVELSFEKDGLHIYGIDHLNKSTIRSYVDGSCMNTYHCKEQVIVCVKQEDLYKVVSSLGKSNYKITFALKDNFRSAMYINVKDIDFNNDNEYIAEVIPKPDQCLDAGDDTAYPLRFKFPAKHFKSLVNNAKKLGSVLVIQKIGDNPLQLTLGGSCKMPWVTVYNDPGKIQLESELAPNDAVVVSVGLDYIKPFSNSGLTEDVRLTIDKTARMSMSTSIDQKNAKYACTIKVFTEIMDARRQNI